MSLVFLTHHNEYIQDLAEYEGKSFYNQPIKYKPQLKDTTDVKKLESRRCAYGKSKEIILSKPDISLHKTMGYAETSWPDPCNFLRKNNGIKFSRMPQHKCYKKEPSSPIPRVTDAPKKTEIKKEKNFKKINVKKVENAIVKRPLPKVATTITGDTKLLCNAGIIPAYIFSPNYGKVPKYLKNAKECAEKCKHFKPKGSSKKPPQFAYPEELYNKKQIEKFKKKIVHLEREKWLERKMKADKNLTTPKMPLPPHITIIPDEVRKEMIAGLKKNFIEIMEKYQKGPVYLDTIPKKLRRCKIEQELRQLEEDVVLLEYNPVIYVCKSVNKNEEK